MKKWIIKVLALLFLGVSFVALNYLIIGVIGDHVRRVNLQDQTVREMYNLIKQSNVDIPKLMFVLGGFDNSSILGQFTFSLLLCSAVIFIYQGVVKLLEKIIR